MNIDIFKNNSKYLAKSFISENYLKMWTYKTECVLHVVWGLELDNNETSRSLYLFTYMNNHSPNIWNSEISPLLLQE